MFSRNGLVATGIDLGSVNVKVIRGVGSSRIEHITHAGHHGWSADGSDVDRAAAGLKWILSRLGLTRNQLGRIATGVDGGETRFREVILPPLNERELQQALPFESRKHLDLEEVASPIVAAQILGPAPPAEEGGPDQTRVLLAAVPRSRRDFALAVLAKLGIEPEVVDLEPLASLNALFASPAAREFGSDQALALLDLGGRRANIYIASRDGGLLGRAVGDPAPVGGPPESVSAYANALAPSLRETLTFFRGRHRQEIAAVFIAGGGADTTGLAELIQTRIDRAVMILDPTEGVGLSARDVEPQPGKRARYVTACGLCRWWDARNV